MTPHVMLPFKPATPNFGPPAPAEAAAWLRSRFPAPDTAWSRRVLSRMALEAGFDVEELFHSPEFRALGLRIEPRPLYPGGEPVLCYVLDPKGGDPE